jgi:hypothetical protein
MKFMALMGLCFIVFQSAVFGQDSVYLRRNAININRQYSLSTNLYDSIAGYRLIMVGEVHGTKEPADFVRSLVALLVKNGDAVQVGLEISLDAMTDFTRNSPDSAIYATRFFRTRRQDNRATEAWANLIVSCNHIPNVSYFYYDVNAGDVKNDTERDSLMYTKIKKRIQLHPTWKTITLGGNIHNMLLPYRGEMKMGLYLYKDTELNLSTSILSIAHGYMAGTMLDDSGTVVEVRRDSDSPFEKTGYDNYLFIYPPNSGYKYNGIYFTRKVTASTLGYKLK